MLRSELYRCRIYNKEQKQTAEEKSEIKTSGSVRINREVGDEVFTDAVQQDRYGCSAQRYEGTDRQAG